MPLKCLSFSFQKAASGQDELELGLFFVFVFVLAFWVVFACSFVFLLFCFVFVFDVCIWRSPALGPVSGGTPVGPLGGLTGSVSIQGLEDTDPAASFA